VNDQFDEIDEYSRHFQFWYGSYYACQAIYHADRLMRPGTFQRYYAVMKDHLLEAQQEDGRWINDVGPGGYPLDGGSIGFPGAGLAADAAARRRDGAGQYITET
jgi:hypothetical protein